MDSRTTAMRPMRDLLRRLALTASSTSLAVSWLNLAASCSTSSERFMWRRFEQGKQGQASITYETGCPLLGSEVEGLSAALG